MNDNEMYDSETNNISNIWVPVDRMDSLRRKEILCCDFIQVFMVLKRVS